LVLLRYPGLFAALAAGTLLLALAAAAYPLFVSSIASGLVSAGVEDPSTTRYGAGVVYRDIGFPLNASVPGDRSTPLAQGLRDLFSARTAQSPLLGPTLSSMLGPSLTISVPGRPERSVQGRLFADSVALQHVHPVEGGGTGEGDGIWLPDLTARGVGVRVGDTVDLQFEEHPPVTVRVDGVFRALVAEPPSAYWHEWNSDIYPSCTTPPDCPLPPQFVLTSPDRFTVLSEAAGIHEVDFALRAPLSPGLEPTLDQAEDLVAFSERFGADIKDQGSAIGKVFRCCPIYYARGYASPRAEVSSEMSRVVSNVAIRVATVESPGRLVQVAGALVASIVVAVAGAFALSTRRVEGRLLFARGIGARTFAAKTSLESVLPCLLGGALGFGLTLLLVRTIGAGGPVASSAVRDASLGAALAVLVSLFLLGIVSAVAFSGLSERRRRNLGWLARLPWELAIVALGLGSLRQILTGGAFVQDSALHVMRPSVSLLLFPVLSIAGFAMLGARGFGTALSSIRSRSGAFSDSLYLAVHRLAGGLRPTILLVAASALCLGIFVQGQVIVRSLNATVDAKAGLFVGSDVEGRVRYDTPLPDRFPFPITRVTRVQDAGSLSAGAGNFDLLAVDPTSLASAAYWSPALPRVSIEEIARALAGPTDDGVPVAIAAGGPIAPTSIQIQGTTVPIHVVARVSAFPGMSSRNPLFIVDGDTLLGAMEGTVNPFQDPNASTELWVKGDEERGSAALAALPYPPYLVLTIDQVKDIPGIAAVIDTFIVLDVLGLVAGLLVLIGMMMYLQARQRSQTVSYGLSLRMGMSHSSHRRSMVAELGVMLCYAYAIGLVLAFGAAALMVPRLDPLSTIPPNPILIPPRGSVAGTLLVLLAVSWLGAWLTNRRARASDLGQVMRVAD